MTGLRSLWFRLGHGPETRPPPQSLYAAAQMPDVFCSAEILARCFDLIAAVTPIPSLHHPDYSGLPP
jgi:hypothetical protein